MKGPARALTRRGCDNHYQRWRAHGSTEDRRAIRSDPAERFWSKVEKTETCWLWTAALNSSGYGSFGLDGRTLGAHVVSVLLDGRAVPSDMEIDHVVCDNPPCVRPDHLRVVARDVNWRRSGSRNAANARKTHCRKGHEFTEANTYMSSRGHRSCRACAAEHQRNLRANRAAAKT